MREKPRLRPKIGALPLRRGRRCRVEGAKMPREGARKAARGEEVKPLRGDRGGDRRRAPAALRGGEKKRRSSGAGGQNAMRPGGCNAAGPNGPALKGVDGCEKEGVEGAAGGVEGYAADLSAAVRGAERQPNADRK